MSASWFDFDNDGNQDVYVSNMWSAAGMRVSEQKSFHEKDPETIRAFYRQHARGNSLYRNLGNGKFQNASHAAGVDVGRWAWASDAWDFDHDGYPDLYIANGYISGPVSRRPKTAGRDADDVAGFFWRQVVANSPHNQASSPKYELGWNAINELIRSDASWNGFERNVFYANNHDGTFSDVSGTSGLDFPDDSRSFVLADLDHDGRLEVILKNRNAPQLRILRNAMKEIGNSIAFRLHGTKSNRDAIGAAVPVNQRIEMEEGSDVFAAKPFVAARARYARTGETQKPEALPTSVETWLIEPLSAPGFSLPDVPGNLRTLSSFRGGFVLLHFWTSASEACREQLRVLHKQHSTFAASGLQILGVNVDDPGDVRAVRSFALKEGLAFPNLLATEDVAGIYNIVYRYLFDRRRDLALPASFLVNANGMIVKVYQGAVNPQRLREDLKLVPGTTNARMKRALPFEGTLYQDEFQRNDFTYGVAMFQRGYLDEAAASFEQVIRAKPEEPEAYYNLGTLYLRKNALPDARRYLEQTVKLRPDYPEAWNNLGMIAGQEGKADEAIRNFQQSLTLRPTYVTAMLNLGNLYRRQGAVEEAEKLLNRALEMEPDNPETNYSLGMLYARQDQLPRASSYLEKAVSLRPDYPDALNNLGVLFVRQENYPEAKEKFETCIRVAPNYDQAYLNLARLYVLLNDKAKAREVLLALLHRQPQHKLAQQALEMLN